MPSPAPNRKPLLIVPPAPERWPKIEALLNHKGQPWLDDLALRFRQGVAGSRDTFAVIFDGGNLLAHAAIFSTADIGILGHVFVAPPVRRQGLASKLIETLLQWFQMTGGHWLYLTTEPALTPLYERFGFQVLHRAPVGDGEQVTMQRRPADGGITPLPLRGGAVTTRSVQRADWPLVLALLQDHPGADPAVGIDTTAVQAERWTLERLAEQAAQRLQLIAAEQNGRIVGLALVTPTAGSEPATIALLPHSRVPAALRQAALKAAHRKDVPEPRILFSNAAETAMPPQEPQPADQASRPD
jgi:GNAT superfamily N-acetyltransferase